MEATDIPAFVDEIIATGCDIRAVEDHSWLIGDADLPYDDGLAVQPELVRIDQYYGKRTHLKVAIISYLNSIGRSYRLSDDDELRREM